VRDTALVGPLSLENYSGLRVVNCVIRHNVADYGAALFCIHAAAPQLIGCLITDNYALRGGAALYCLDSHPRLTSCTIVANHDINPEPMDAAAAVLSFISKPQTTGCIFWDNETNFFMGGQFIEAKPFYTTWSDIAGGFAGTGNLDQDPQFTASGEHPYSLEPYSPCVDAGPPDTSALPLPPFDLAGGVRIVGGRIDVGAYESNPATAAPPAVPAMVLLEPNFPNPFNPTTTIRLTLTAPAHVHLAIFDVSGHLITTLHDAVLPPGAHTVSWSGRDARGEPQPSGIYFCRLQTDTGWAGQIKMLLVK